MNKSKNMNKSKKLNKIKRKGGMVKSLKSLFFNESDEPESKLTDLIIKIRKKIICPDDFYEDEDDKASAHKAVDCEAADCEKVYVEYEDRKATSVLERVDKYKTIIKKYMNTIKDQNVDFISFFESELEKIDNIIKGEYKKYTDIKKKRDEDLKKFKKKLIDNCEDIEVKVLKFLLSKVEKKQKRTVLKQKLEDGILTYKDLDVFRNKIIEPFKIKSHILDEVYFHDIQKFETDLCKKILKVDNLIFEDKDIEKAIIYHYTQAFEKLPKPDISESLGSLTLTHEGNIHNGRGKRTRRKNKNLLNI